MESGLCWSAEHRQESAPLSHDGSLASKALPQPRAARESSSPLSVAMPPFQHCFRTTTEGSLSSYHLLLRRCVLSSIIHSILSTFSLTHTFYHCSPPPLMYSCLCGGCVTDAQGEHHLLAVVQSSQPGSLPLDARGPNSGVISGALHI